MSTARDSASAPAVMGAFERYLSLWVGLAIIAGVIAGNALPAAFHAVSRMEWAGVNLVVAALIWAMIYPMMVAVDLRSLARIGASPKGLVLTVTTNWLIKPFTMAALGLLFFRYLYADWVSAEDAKQYIAGMILLGVAPCTAMVFVWSRLTNGDPNYTLAQVALNDIILVFAFAPLAALLLGISDVFVPWHVLLASVALYVMLPLAAGALTRERLIRRHGSDGPGAFEARTKPVAVAGLILMVVLLFGLQAERLLDQPQAIVLIAIPLIIQSVGIFALGYLWAWWWRLPIAVAGPAALIGTSNFFELAVAVAIGLFGLHSGAALATVVGVLVEVPIMLLLVDIVNRTRTRFPTSAVVSPR